MSTTPEPPQYPQGAVPPPPPPSGTGGTSGPYAGPPPTGFPPPSDRAAGYPPGQASGYPPPSPYPAAPGSHPPPAYGPGAPLSPSDQRLWAVLSHVLTLLVGFFAPLVVWLVFKGRGAFSEDHSRESLNFQITMTIAAIALAFVTVVTFGIGGLLYIPFGILVVVLVIVASVKASQGEPYRYPLTYRFIR